MPWRTGWALTVRTTRVGCSTRYRTATRPPAARSPAAACASTACAPPSSASSHSARAGTTRGSGRRCTHAHHQARRPLLRPSLLTPLRQHAPRHVRPLQRHGESVRRDGGWPRDVSSWNTMLAGFVEPGAVCGPTGSCSQAPGHGHRGLHLAEG
jgi:hypothetical protein